MFFYSQQLSKLLVLRNIFVQKKFLDFSLGNDFSGYNTKAQATKARNKLMGLHQTKKLCTAKERAKQKATCGMGENIGKSYI